MLGVSPVVLSVVVVSAVAELSKLVVTCSKRLASVDDVSMVSIESKLLCASVAAAGSATGGLPPGGDTFVSIFAN